MSANPGRAPAFQVVGVDLNETRRVDRSKQRVALTAELPRFWRTGILVRSPQRTVDSVEAGGRGQWIEVARWRWLMRERRCRPPARSSTLLARIARAAAIDRWPTRLGQSAPERGATHSAAPAQCHRESNAAVDAVRAERSWQLRTGGVSTSHGPKQSPCHSRCSLTGTLFARHSGIEPPCRHKGIWWK